jgi:hypothetical protein
MEKVKRVVQIVSGDIQQCVHCDFIQGLDMDIDEVINHYFKHDYKLLHVGQQTTHDIDGNLWQKTIAILGTED